MTKIDTKLNVVPCREEDRIYFPWAAEQAVRLGQEIPFAYKLAPTVRISKGRPYKFVRGRFEGIQNIYPIYNNLQSALDEQVVGLYVGDSRLDIPDVTQMFVRWLNRDQDPIYIPGEGSIVFSSGDKGYNESRGLEDLFLHTGLHEYGHAIAYAVMQDLQFRDPDFRKEIRFIPNGYSPLFRSFAEVAGWKATKNASGEPIFENPEYSVIPENSHQFKKVVRSVRISPYASATPINEAFPEYFATFYTCPQRLTTDEKGFFRNLDEGLRADAIQFIEEISRDSQSLLK